MNQKEVEKECSSILPLDKQDKVNNIMVSLNWLYSNGYLILSPKEVKFYNSKLLLKYSLHDKLPDKE